MSRRLQRLYSATERLKHWFDERFTPLGKFFLIILLFASFFGVSVQSSMNYQLFSAFCCFLLFSFIGRRNFSADLEIERGLPKSCVVGSEVRYTLKIKNAGKRKQRELFYREAVERHIPSFYEFSTSKEEGEEKRNFFDRKMGYYRWLWLLKIGRRLEEKSHALHEIEGLGRVSLDVSFKPLRRGNVHLQGYYLTRTDPFGLCKYDKFVPEPRNVLVLPKIYPVPQLEFSGSRKYHQGGISGTQDLGDSPEFFGLKEYMPGDPLKHIDWKATARSGKVVVKKYQDEYFSRYGLVLDSFTTKRFCPLFEEAVSISASFLLDQNLTESVLDLLFVENECVISTSGRGIGDHRRMLEILAQISTCRDRGFSTLSSLVKDHSTLLSGVILVLIDFDDERRELIDFLQQNRVPLKVLVVTDDIKKIEEKAKEFPGVIYPIKISGDIGEQLTLI